MLLSRLPWILRLADALFGPPANPTERAERWGWRFVGTSSLLVGLIAARRIDAVTNPQFWAEDGCLFFLENVTLGFWRALWEFYRGSPYLLPRLIAAAGGLVPVADAPPVYTISAMLLTGLALATFVAPGFRHLVRSDVLRVAWGAAVVCLPMFTQEVLSTPTNLGWFAAIWCTLVSLMRLPRSVWSLALLGGATAAAVLSTPLAVLTLPLWVLRAFRAAHRHDRRELAFSLAPVGLMVLVILASREPGVQGSMPATAWFADLVRVARQLGFSMASLLWPPVASTASAARWHPAAAPLALAAVVGLLGTAGLAGRRRVILVLLMLTLASGALAMLLVAREVWIAIFPELLARGRYTVYPDAMLVLAAAIALDGLPAGRTRLAATLGTSVFLLGAWGPSILISPFQDFRWKGYAPRVERALQSACPVHLQVPLNPFLVPLDIAWGPVLPDKPVRPAQIVGSLGPTGQFGQPFVSECDGLSSVEIVLGEMAASRLGELDLTLVDDSGVVAATRIPRSSLVRGDWQPLCFPPIDRSAGRRFTLVVRAIENDLAASVLVLGEMTDPGPERRAWYAGRWIEGQAAVRYGCRSHAPHGCFQKDG